LLTSCENVQGEFLHLQPSWSYRRHSRAKQFPWKRLF